MNKKQSVNIKANNPQFFLCVYEHKPMTDVLSILSLSLIELRMLWARHSHDVVGFLSQFCFAP